MIYRPLIGVVGFRLDPSRVSGWPDGGVGVPGPYVDALQRAGARIAVLVPEGEGEPEELLDAFDGLLLVGGGDVEPSRYGAVPRTDVLRRVDPERDAFEVGLLRTADRLAVPTLCICRGVQVMNVAFGGTLHQHIPDIAGLGPHEPGGDYGTLIHDVMAEPGTRLAAVTKSAAPLACWSGHHQAVERLGDGLRVSGRSPDGLIEAIERDVPAGWGVVGVSWMVGVQWHPERTAVDDPAQQALFDAITQLARVRGSRARDDRDPPGWSHRIG